MVEDSPFIWQSCVCLFAGIIVYGVWDVFYTYLDAGRFRPVPPLQISMLDVGQENVFLKTLQTNHID